MLSSVVLCLFFACLYVQPYFVLRISDKGLKVQYRQGARRGGAVCVRRGGYLEFTR